MGAVKTIKYCLLVINIIVALSGLIMLITGGVIQTEINSQKMSKTISGYSTTSGSVICIIFGIAVMFFGCLGFYATLKDHYGFLYAYSVLMFVAFLVQFITGVVGLAVRDSADFDKYAEKVFAHELNLNTTNKGEQDFYQEKFKCCGWNGISDYMYANNSLNAPKSCCKVKDNCDPTRKDQLVDTPCNYKMMDAARGIIGSVGVVMLIFSIVNFVSILLSIYMAKQIRSGYQYTS